MAIEKVKQYFKKHNLEDRILEFNVSSATVELAAKAAGIEAAKIAKTLSFKVADKTILIVCAGDTRIDNKKYKAEFSQRPKMLARDEVEAKVGHDVGGVCPFVINADVAVYLDCSLKRFAKVYPACGSANSIIELNLAELEKHAQMMKWVDVCKYY